MTTAAITGGTGFIGRALAEALVIRGDRVRVLTRRPGSQPRGAIAFEGDLASTVPEAFADGADVVFHLAAEIRDTARMHEVNVRGTERLLKASVGRCGRWIQLSSVGVYGPPLQGEDITESTFPRPANAYERSKLEADRAVERDCSSAGCPWGVLRPSNVVGRTMRNESAFALVRAIVGGRFIYVGSRDAMSTYVHVADVVGALLAIASAPAGTIANLSSDCTWTHLVKRICERAGCREPRLRLPATCARLVTRTLGVIPGFPLTQSRIDALSRIGGYPIGAALAMPGFRVARPMPEGFDEVIDTALRTRSPESRCVNAC
jgi:nucleoside-diphosphate-sugar epimerase